MTARFKMGDMIECKWLGREGFGINIVSRIEYTEDDIYYYTIDSGKPYISENFINPEDCHKTEIIK